ncbi:hypothetical protein BDZ91DRAFT_763812 [Kalaharituber pfeilii]|nr:hypothetical protein BDZ91DRAFT_763812 [Kalaharituber pfeilii]
MVAIVLETGGLYVLAGTKKVLEVLKFEIIRCTGRSVIIIYRHKYDISHEHIMDLWSVRSSCKFILRMVGDICMRGRGDIGLMTKHSIIWVYARSARSYAANLKVFFPPPPLPQLYRFYHSTTPTASTAAAAATAHTAATAATAATARTTVTAPTARSLYHTLHILAWLSTCIYLLHQSHTSSKGYCIEDTAIYHTIFGDY